MRIEHPGRRVRTMLTALVEGSSQAPPGSSQDPSVSSRAPQGSSRAPLNNHSSLSCPSITNAIDVHVFDGEWRVPADLPRFSEPQRQALFGWAVRECPESLGVKMVIDDAGQAPNYDPRSGAMACDLLAAILSVCRGFDGEMRSAWLNELAVQLFDSWTTGRCPQGRTTRLYQLWLSLPRASSV